MKRRWYGGLAVLPILLGGCGTNPDAGESTGGGDSSASAETSGSGEEITVEGTSALQ